MIERPSPGSGNTNADNPLFLIVKVTVSPSCYADLSVLMVSIPATELTATKYARIAAGTPITDSMTKGSAPYAFCPTMR